MKINSEPPKPATFEDLGYVKVVTCIECEHCVDIDMFGFVQCDKYGNHDPKWYCGDGSLNKEERKSIQC